MNKKCKKKVMQKKKNYIKIIINNIKKLPKKMALNYDTQFVHCTRAPIYATQLRHSITAFNYGTQLQHLIKALNYGT